MLPAGRSCFHASTSDGVSQASSSWIAKRVDFSAARRFLSRAARAVQLPGPARRASRLPPPEREPEPSVAAAPRSVSTWDPGHRRRGSRRDGRRRGAPAAVGARRRGTSGRRWLPAAAGPPPEDTGRERKYRKAPMRRMSPARTPPSTAPVRDFLGRRLVGRHRLSGGDRVPRGAAPLGLPDAHVNHFRTQGRPRSGLVERIFAKHRLRVLLRRAGIASSPDSSGRASSRADSGSGSGCGSGGSRFERARREGCRDGVPGRSGRGGHLRLLRRPLDLLHEAERAERRQQLAHGELVRRRRCGNLVRRRGPIDQPRDRLRVGRQPEGGELAVEFFGPYERHVRVPELVIDEVPVPRAQEELEEQPRNGED